MKKKSELSCWNWKHPIRSIKNAWWRITKGFCPSDIWDWYTYQAQLIHDSLMYWSDNNLSTPLEYEECPNKWSEELESVARKLLYATNWEDKYENPFKEKYFDEMGKVRYVRKEEDGRVCYTLDYSEVDENISKNYQHVDQRNYERARREIKESLEWLADNWFDLWD